MILFLIWLIGIPIMSCLFFADWHYGRRHREWKGRTFFEYISSERAIALFVIFCWPVAVSFIFLIWLALFMDGH